MPLDDDTATRLRRFVETTRFREAGAVVTDLDGTAVHEFEGRVVIPATVEHGLKALYDGGHPVVINSLRFPLSVMRSFGREWLAIADAPIPTVSLNGSQIGYVAPDGGEGMVFEEIDAFPLEAAEIDEVLRGIEALVEGGLSELLVFHYPRDWRLGEIVWTPVPARIPAVREKYRSAAEIVSTPLDGLRALLHAREVCMVFMLVEVPQDRLMAYQHTRRSSFFTRSGVDKLHGAREIAARLGLSLPDSVGAGDAETDRFLAAVGLAVHVGNLDLEFHGVSDTVKVPNVGLLGELLHALAALGSRSR